MGLFDIFKKKQQDNVERVGGMEDFMTLIRVYYESVMACNLGITNLAFLPDVAVFKRTLKVPTQNNKLGVAERSRSRKMLKEIYGLSDNFFKEVDQSIKKNCRNVGEIKNFLFLFQGFSQDLMMCVGTLMKWKFRVPSVFRKTIYQFTAKAVNDILTRYEWKDDAMRKTCSNLRKYQHTLGYSADWMTEYAFNILLLAKKETKPKDED